MEEWAMAKGSLSFSPSLSSSYFLLFFFIYEQSSLTYGMHHAARPVAWQRCLTFGSSTRPSFFFFFSHPLSLSHSHRQTHTDTSFFFFFLAFKLVYLKTRCIFSSSFLFFNKMTQRLAQLVLILRRVFFLLPTMCSLVTIAPPPPRWEWMNEWHTTERTLPACLPVACPTGICISPFAHKRSFCVQFLRPDTQDNRSKSYDVTSPMI